MRAEQASSIAMEVHRKDAPLYNETLEDIKRAANIGLFAINIYYPGRVVVELLEEDGYDISKIDKYNQITISW